MGKPIHISVIIKEVLSDLANRQSRRAHPSGKLTLSRLRDEIRQKGVSRSKAVR